MTTRDSSASIDDRAADWVARQDAAREGKGELSTAESAALEAWLAADPRHLGAYARAHAVLAHFDRARAPGATRQAGARNGASSLLRRPFVAAAAAAALLSIVWVAGSAITASMPGHDVMATAVGEIRRNPLEDGSAITLNTGSETKTRMTQDVRTVVLVAGEALFDVAADPSRPFRVRAGDVTVTAVGTSFTVRLRPDDTVDVVVREGVVEVVREGETPVRIAANEVLQWRPEGGPTRSTRGAEGVDRAIAWRNGMINLDNLTLAEASAEFARYGGVAIRVPEPDIAALRVTGLFSASDPAGFARAAALSLGLDVRPDGNTITLVATDR